MVAGHLQEKKGYFYIVLNYKNHEGKRKSKWITSGLTVKVIRNEHKISFKR